MLRRFILAALAACLLAGAASARPSALAATAPAGTPRFLITGHGWGHGVGMSQYGAYGYAQKGLPYDQILAHYYPGTELGRAPVRTVRVLLASGATATVRSAGAVRVKDAAGTAGTLDPGTWKLGPGLRLKLPDAEGAEPLVSPVTLTPTTAPLQFKRPYRGSLVLTSNGKKVTVVNQVGLEQYLYGVVPSEMPHDWHAEALKAQAVVARSYALAVRKSDGPFDLYSDTRSQVYRGIQGEKPETNAAVAATAGQVLLYGGKVALTYFFSTSGGRTADVSDVWNSQPIPYLVSVADPFDVISPYHDWGPLFFSATKLRGTFKVPGKLLDVQTAVNSSGRVSTLTAIGTKGEVEVAAGDVRRVLGLRSTWFRVGVLALDPLPAKAVAYGDRATLTGLGRGLSDVRLEQRPVGTTAWQAAGAVKAKADGAVAIAVKATGPAQYRLASGRTATDLTTLRVTPKLRLQVPNAPTALGGTVQPTIAGATVWIQRAVADRWTTVVSARVDDGGTFSAPLTVTPGTYRARIAPGRGWTPALSNELRVVKT